MKKLTVMKRLTMALLAASVIAIATPALGDTPPVNVNTADAAELTSVSGIGPSKAKAIVEHRDDNGPFASVDDLQSVRGIGNKLIERLRPQVTVGEETQTEEKSE